MTCIAAAIGWVSIGHSPPAARGLGRRFRLDGGEVARLALAHLGEWDSRDLGRRVGRKDGYRQILRLSDVESPERSTTPFQQPLHLITRRIGSTPQLLEHRITLLPCRLARLRRPVGIAAQSHPRGDCQPAQQLLE